VRFKDINFGFASADWEAAQQPDLLLRGFIDPHKLAHEARVGKRWLFLGYKGSGKSALGEHLRLVAENDPEMFVNVINIGDVSFSTFSQILKGRFEPESRYPTVWSWLLLIYLFSSFSTDEGAESCGEEPFFLAIEALKELGLLPQPTLSEAVVRTSDSGFSLKLTSAIGGIEAAWKKSKTDTDLPFFVEHLRLLARSFKSPNKHILVVDGFDDLLRRGTLQYDALGALIYEVNRLNIDFANSGVPAKILVLCRTDLFERLPGANKNKIRQNAAVHINWDYDPRNPHSSPLVNLINRRASLNGEEVDVFSEFLPEQLSSRRSDIRVQLLSHTRAVPRDMVMLFKSLQDHSGDGRMTPSQVGNALTAYSRDYLLPEIKDELDGYVEGEDIKAIFQIFGALREISPAYEELSQRARMHNVRADIDKILNAMYECSAIGNLRDRRSNFLTFKYRDRHTSFNPNELIMIHEGLWRALNLRW
jgi:hypothetical protein